MIPALPDDCLARLHATGWTVGETCFDTAGAVWQVDATNGVHVFMVLAETQTAAWRLAAEQAAVVGGDPPVTVDARGR